MVRITESHTVAARMAAMSAATTAVVVGLDVGGAKTNATVLSEDGRFLVDHMVEVPSGVLDGPVAAIAAIDEAMELVLGVTATPRAAARAVGLDTPEAGQRRRGDLGARGHQLCRRRVVGLRLPPARSRRRLHLPVIYNNDGNAAALYAHERHFGDEASRRSSVSAIVGTELGGGVIEAGRVVRGAAGMAGELGHVQIPMDGLLVAGQPVPRCNCGFAADLESVASLSGIANNLLPFWLTRYPDHPLADVDIGTAASWFAISESGATSWPFASSSSRRWRSGGCSPSPPTSPTPTPTSSAAG